MSSLAAPTNGTLTNLARPGAYLREELFSWGATELLASPVAAGNDRDASLDRTLRLLGQLARALPA